MPPPKYIEWLMEEVRANPQVAGVWWFMYCDTPDDNPERIRGAKNFPDSLAELTEIGAKIPKRYQPKVDLGTKDDAQGITLVQYPQGNTVPANVGGINCRKSASAQDQYFYFDIVDTFVNMAKPDKAYLRVDYYDSTGTIQPQYDGLKGEYAGAEPVKLQGTNSWKAKVWVLGDCHFGNRQASGADFRLKMSGDSPVYIDEVAISLIPFTPRDKVAPTTPSSLTGVGLSSSAISLTWKPSKDNSGGLVSYKVFRNGKHIGTVATNSFSDGKMAPNTRYTYALSAYDKSGNESARSAVVRAATKPRDTKAPTVPTGTMANGKTFKSILVAWSASKDNVRVTGYKVFRNGKLIGTCGTSYYWDNGLRSETEYAYTVSAYDAAGNESAQSSVPAKATTLKASSFVIGNVRATGGYVCEAVDNLKVGDLFYTDRQYTFSAVPDAYLGLAYIRTANNFNNRPFGGLTISFDISAPAFIYVAWPADSPMPQWLKTDYVPVRQEIEGSWGRTFWMYHSKAPHPAGRVVNRYTRGLGTMYSIILEPVGVR